MEARIRSASAPEVGRLRAAAVGTFAETGFPQFQAEEFVGSLDNDVVLSMFDVAPDQALAAVHAPIRVIYGSKDDVIAPSLSAEAATAALSGNADAMVVTIVGMSHELQRVPPAPDAGLAPEDGTLPGVIDLIGDWLARRLSNASRDR